LSIFKDIQDISLEIYQDILKRFTAQHGYVKVYKDKVRCRGIFAELKNGKHRLCRLTITGFHNEIGKWVGRTCSYYDYLDILKLESHQITNIQKMLYYENNNIEIIVANIISIFDRHFYNEYPGMVYYEDCCFIDNISYMLISNHGCTSDINHDDVIKHAIALLTKTNYIDLIENGLFGREMAELCFDVFIESVRHTILMIINLDVKSINAIIVKMLDCWDDGEQLSGIVEEWQHMMVGIIAQKKQSLM
jgi:hypothetical protein